MTRPNFRQMSLITSLFLNVIFVGLAIGIMLRWQSGWISNRQQMYVLRTAANELQPRNRTAYLSALRAVPANNTELIRISRRARRQALTDFVKPVFDANAIKASLSLARKSDFALRTKFEDALINVAATLPADERQHLANGLRRAGPLKQSKPN